MPITRTPTIDGVPLQVTRAHSSISATVCPVGPGADVLPGRHEVGEWVVCLDCGQEHETVVAVAVDVVEAVAEDDAVATILSQAISTAYIDRSLATP